MTKWAKIPAYDSYIISNFGVVKSLKFKKERILKSSKNVNGYLEVALCLNGSAKTFPIHKLMAISFLGHIPNKLNTVIDHINNIKTDNRLDNLQLISNRINCSKDRENGTSKFTGVYAEKKTKKWRASIVFNRRNIHLGSFENELDAADKYKKALLALECGYNLDLLYPKKNILQENKGITFDKLKNKWRIRIKRKHIGYFQTKEQAIKKMHLYQ